MKKQIILLESPQVIQADRPETFTVDGFSCPECKGKGLVLRHCFDDADVDVRGWGTVPCSVCGGTGEVYADITVRWRKKDEARHEI